MTAATRETRLFTVRMWREEVADGRLEWRGKVQALPEGDAYYFHGYAGLIERLRTMLDIGYGETSDSEGAEEVPDGSNPI